MKNCVKIALKLFNVKGEIDETSLKHENSNNIVHLLP